MYVLEDLWKGNITPYERSFCDGSRYADLTHQTTEDENVFCAELSASGKEAFQSYYDKQMEIADIAEQDAFIKGVRIGARFILDVIGEYHSQLPQIGECV